MIVYALKRGDKYFSNHDWMSLNRCTLYKHIDEADFALKVLSRYLKEVKIVKVEIKEV